MNFGGISSYEQNIHVVKGTDAPASSDKVVNARAANASALGGASAGQVVTGEVVGVHGKQVQIKLPDSQVVTARMEADIKLSAGQSVAFEVKSNSGSQIALTPLFGSQAVNPAAIRALGQASILVNSTSLQMAESMMSQGMSVDRNSLQAMFRQVNKFPGADAASIVEMTKQGLSIDENSIEQYGAYKKNEHQIMGLTEGIADSLLEMVDGLTAGEKSAFAAIFSGAATTDVTLELQAGLQKQVTDYVGQLALEQENAVVKPTILDILSNQASGGDVSEQLLEETAAQDEPAVVVYEDTDMNRVLSAEQRNYLADALLSLGMSEESAVAIRNGTMEPQTALSYIQSAIDMAENGQIDALSLPEETRAAHKTLIKELSESDVFKALMKDAVVKDFSLKSDGTTDKESVQKLYNRILEDTGKAQALLEQLGKGDSAMARGLDNLRQNVNFMNQLNEAFTYVQLPIQMSGDNAHGDLYVYTNKKKLMEKDGEVTALLHLEMEALGTMDIHVALRDSNFVKTHFELANEEMLDFVEENIHLLDERLQKRGYNVSIDAAVKKDDPKAPENPAIAAMLGAPSDGSEMTRIKYSFDMKA